ncbi:hypothetical protein D3C81_2073510 [compost metagenome]
MIGISITSRAGSTPHMSKSLSQMPSNPCCSSCCARRTTARAFSVRFSRFWIHGLPWSMLYTWTSTSGGTTGAIEASRPSL